MNANRRLQERKQPERMVFCKLGDEEWGSVQNLSEAGLRFESLTPIGAKSLLHLRLLVDPTCGVDAVAYLAWVDAAKRTGGLRFLELSAPAREQIRLWLSDPSAAEVPEGAKAEPAAGDGVGVPATAAAVLPAAAVVDVGALAAATEALPAAAVVDVGPVAPAAAADPAAVVDVDAVADATAALPAAAAVDVDAVAPATAAGGDAGAVGGEAAALVDVGAISAAAFPAVLSAAVACNDVGAAATAADAAVSEEEPRAFLRKRDEQPEGEAASAEKPVVWQELHAPSTLLVPMERYWADRRSQFLRGVLVGFLICAAMTIPVIWYLGGAKSNSPAQASARPAADSRAEETQASVAQMAPSSAPPAEPAEVRTVYVPTPSASPKTQRQVAPTGGALLSDAKSRTGAFATPQQARAVQQLSATAAPLLAATPAQPLARPGSEMAAAPFATDGRSSADKAQRPKKASATPQQLWSAVEAGNMKAAVALADLYERGDGVPVNCDQARVLLMVASAKRNAEAPKKLEELDKGGCTATPH